MLAIERKNEILSILQKEQSVLVSDLSQRYRVTEETIRRDLEKLEKEGFVKKTYGGAVLNENTNTDLPFKIRERTNKSEKMAIANQITELVAEGESIVMDSSSTSLMAAKILKHYKNLTVVTNSVEILLEMSGNKGIHLICTGGAMRDSALSLGGKIAENTLLNFNVDKAIMSCKGIDMQKGITDSNEFEANLKTIMASCATEIIWLVDSSKFGRVNFVKIMDFRPGDRIVSEKVPDGNWLDFFREQNVRFVCAEDASRVDKRTAAGGE